MSKYYIFHPSGLLGCLFCTCVFFFFQAEDGIRDVAVTGVQTCALPISYENIGRTDEALYHSEAYLQVSSSIPHAHHMRGHELRRAGRIEDAIEEFRKANELENAYYRTERIRAEYDWHRPHNLTLLAICYQLLGQMRAAEQLRSEERRVGKEGRSRWSPYH